MDVGRQIQMARLVGHEVVDTQVECCKQCMHSD